MGPLQMTLQMGNRGYNPYSWSYNPLYLLVAHSERIFDISISSTQKGGTSPHLPPHRDDDLGSIWLESYTSAHAKPQLVKPNCHTLVYHKCRGVAMGIVAMENPDVSYKNTS